MSSPMETAAERMPDRLPELPDTYVAPAQQAMLQVETLPGYHASLWNDNDLGFARMKAAGVLPADAGCPYIPEHERKRLRVGFHHGFRHRDRQPLCAAAGGHGGDAGAGATAAPAGGAGGRDERGSHLRADDAHGGGAGDQEVTSDEWRVKLGHRFQHEERTPWRSKSSAISLGA